MGFAAITDDWVAPGGRVVRQVATLTCAPNADVARVHDRMGCILRADQVAAWLAGPEDEAQELLRPLTDGVLTIRKAEGVDWTAA